MRTGRGNWSRTGVAAAIAIAAVAGSLAAGCGSKEVKTPLSTGSPEQVKATQAKAAADYAAYMESRRQQQQGQ